MEGVLFCDGVKAGDRCYVAYNMHWLDHEFAVPPLSKKKKWHLALDTANAVLDGVGKSVTVSARSIVVLVGE